MTQNGRCESLTQPHHFISVLSAAGGLVIVFYLEFVIWCL